MKVAEIRIMYEYNYWANHLLLTVCAQVSAEQFAAPTTDSFGSLRGTLLHTLDAEREWREVFQYLPYTPTLAEADFPTLESIKARWKEEEAAMWAYLDSLRDEDLDGILRYTTDTGIQRERVLWHCLFHLVNHGMQHRSEVAAILTDYGHSPGNIDFTLFLNQRASGK